MTLEKQQTNNFNFKQYINLSIFDLTDEEQESFEAKIKVLETFKETFKLSVFYRTDIISSFTIRELLNPVGYGRIIRILQGTIGIKEKSPIDILNNDSLVLNIFSRIKENNQYYEWKERVKYTIARLGIQKITETLQNEFMSQCEKESITNSYFRLMTMCCESFKIYEILIDTGILPAIERYIGYNTAAECEKNVIMHSQFILSLKDKIRSTALFPLILLNPSVDSETRISIVKKYFSVSKISLYKSILRHNFTSFKQIDDFLEATVLQNSRIKEKNSAIIDLIIKILVPTNREESFSLNTDCYSGFNDFCKKYAKYIITDQLTLKITNPLSIDSDNANKYSNLIQVINNCLDLCDFTDLEILRIAKRVPILFKKYFEKINTNKIKKMTVDEKTELAKLALSRYSGYNNDEATYKGKNLYYLLSQFSSTFDSREFNHIQVVNGSYYNFEGIFKSQRYSEDEYIEFITKYGSYVDLKDVLATTNLSSLVYFSRYSVSKYSETYKDYINLYFKFINSLSEEFLDLLLKNEKNYIKLNLLGAGNSKTITCGYIDDYIKKKILLGIYLKKVNETLEDPSVKTQVKELLVCDLVNTEFQQFMSTAASSESLSKASNLTKDMGDFYKRSMAVNDTIEDSIIENTNLLLDIANNNFTKEYFVLTPETLETIKSEIENFKADLSLLSSLS